MWKLIGWRLVTEKRDRKDGFRGVVLDIRHDYVFENLDIDTNAESIFVKLTLDKNKTLIIGSVYRPPSSDAVYMEDLYTSIEVIGQRFRMPLFGL